MKHSSEIHQIIPNMLAPLKPLSSHSSPYCWLV